MRTSVTNGRYLPSGSRPGERPRRDGRRADRDHPGLPIFRRRSARSRRQAECVSRPHPTRTCAASRGRSDGSRPIAGVWPAIVGIAIGGLCWRDPAWGARDRITGSQRFHLPLQLVAFARRESHLFADRPIPLVEDFDQMLTRRQVQPLEQFRRRSRRGRRSSRPRRPQRRSASPGRATSSRRSSRRSDRGDTGYCP